MKSKEEILLFMAHAGITIGIPVLLVVGIYLISL
tara:strand:+ start:3769 stop:3870 length:102 start_codon:yes stop_codon:yes gene_type:complete